MAKLSISKRDEIIHSQVKKNFYGKESKLETKIKKKIQIVAKSALPKWMTKARLEEGYFQLGDNTKFIDYKHTEILDWRVRQLSTSLPVRHSVYKAEVPYCEKLQALIIELKELYDKKAKFRAELSKCLYAFSTDVKLLKVMPELKSYFKDNYMSTALVPLEAINKMRKEIKK